MKALSILFLFVFTGVLTYEQHRFTLKMERFELISYNHSFFDYMKLTTYKYNRTQACMNATALFKVAFRNDLKVEVQAYRFASNEYREFPIRFAFDFCETAYKNDFGMGNIVKCGNMTGCPLRKATYHVCNWFPDASRFPPHIPSGSYMVDTKLFYHSHETMFLQAYVIIEYPIPY